MRLGDQEPWLIPERLLAEPAFAALREACGEKPDPLPLTVPTVFPASVAANREEFGPDADRPD